MYNSIQGQSAFLSFNNRNVSLNLALNSQAAPKSPIAIALNENETGIAKASMYKR
jgi:hypothetical protein